jgi:hypothetical protein
MNQKKKNHGKKKREPGGLSMEGVTHPCLAPLFPGLFD